MALKPTTSLRATGATHLFENGTDEQLIMSRTGHRSIDGVRAYKRVSDKQRQILSERRSNRKKRKCEVRINQRQLQVSSQ